MLTDISPSTRTVGFWSAVLATVFSLTYSVGQIAEWLGWLGSGGGAENLSTPAGLVVLLTPSLFLGSSFLVLVVAIHQLSPPERRVWSHAAVAFATVYAALISINYYVQLTWVLPRLTHGQTAGIETFLFTPFDSFLYAVDILGYSFMSLATLFAAQVFTGSGHQRVVRRFLIANGLLLPFIALQMYVHWLIWIAALWAITFPGATWSLAMLFRRAKLAAPAGNVPLGLTDSNSQDDDVQLPHVRRRQSSMLTPFVLGDMTVAPGAKSSATVVNPAVRTPPSRSADRTQTLD